MKKIYKQTIFWIIITFIIESILSLIFLFYDFDYNYMCNTMPSTTTLMNISFNNCSFLQLYLKYMFMINSVILYMISLGIFIFCLKKIIDFVFWIYERFVEDRCEYKGCKHSAIYELINKDGKVIIKLCFKHNRIIREHELKKSNSKNKIVSIKR